MYIFVYILCRALASTRARIYIYFDPCFHGDTQTVCVLSQHFSCRRFLKMSAQAESVIRNIIREITLECSAQGETVSETLAAFIVSRQYKYAGF